MRRVLRILISLLIIGIVFTWIPNIFSYDLRYIKYHVLLCLLIGYNVAYGNTYKFGFLETVVIVGFLGEIFLSLLRISSDFLRLTELVLIFINMSFFFKGKNEFRIFLNTYMYFTLLISILSLISVPFVIYGYVYEIPRIFGYEYLKEVSTSYSTFVSSDYLQITPLGVIFNSDARVLSIIGFNYTLCGFSYEPHVAMFMVVPGLLVFIGSSRGLKRIILITVLVLFALLTSSVTGILGLIAVLVIANVRRILYILPVLGVFLMGLSIFTPIFDAIQQFILYKFSDASTSRFATYEMANYLFSLNSFLGNGFFKLPETSSSSAGVFGSLFYLVFIAFWFRNLMRRNIRYNALLFLPLLYTTIHMLKLPIQVFNYPFYFFTIIMLSNARKIVTV